MGKILFINDLVSYGANTPDEIKQAFQEAWKVIWPSAKKEESPQTIRLAEVLIPA